MSNDLNLSKGGHPEYPVHSLMSRTGSFPIQVAIDLLKLYSKSNSIVMDPFCGKGTTLLAARALGLESYGLDVAPEAIACTKAKMVSVDFDSLRDYISKLQFDKAPLDGVPDSVKIFFESDTLAQIIGIKKKIFQDINSKDTEKIANASFALGVLLGILHGHATYSLSISSAHAYAMAPNYVNNYAKMNGFIPPHRDVKECLLKKAKYCLSVPLPCPIQNQVIQGSVYDLENHFPHLKKKVDIIFTSPPYLNSQTYPKDNWLRLWLLGYDYKRLRPQYIQTSSISTYSIMMNKVFDQFSKMLKKEGCLICIAGDIRRTIKMKGKVIKSIFRTGSFLEDLCNSNGFGFEIIDTSEHKVPSKSRYYHALNKSNGHSNFDFVERVFIAKKMT